MSTQQHRADACLFLCNSVIAETILFPTVVSVCMIASPHGHMPLSTERRSNLTHFAGRAVQTSLDAVRNAVIPSAQKVRSPCSTGHCQFCSAPSPPSSPSLLLSPPFPCLLPLPASLSLPLEETAGLLSIV